MLRKMYLVPVEQRQIIQAKQPKRLSRKPLPPKKPKRPKPRSRLHPYDKWVKVRGKIREDEIEREARVKEVADLLKSVLPHSSPPPPPVVHRRQTTPTQTEVRVATPPTVPVGDIYETPKRRPDEDVDDDDDDVADGTAVEKDAQEYGREKFGAVAGSYLTPYLYKRSFLDTQYGIRKEGDVFMIGDSSLTVDSESDIMIKGKDFRGTRGLWELMTRRNVQWDKITTDDLKAYKKILLLTNGHLTGYEPDGNIYISSGKKFREVIAKLFPPQTRQRRGIESALRRKWVRYDK